MNNCGLLSVVGRGPLVVVVVFEISNNDSVVERSVAFVAVPVVIAVVGPVVVDKSVGPWVGGFGFGGLGHTQCIQTP